MDLSGRLPQSKSLGAQYYLLFIDDMTRMKWAYFLKSKQKQEVQKVFEDFRSMVEKQSPFGGEIKRIRADNGEFDNSVLKEVFSESGLIFEPAPPYTQSMNGVSERAMRTTMEMARSMMAGADLLGEKQEDSVFWEEAVRTAVYLRNRSPTSALKAMTLFEAWNGRKPSLEHVKPFGCLVYNHVPNERRKKLEKKAKDCLFIGYSETTNKVYRIFDSSRRSTNAFVDAAARNVVIDEKVFPGFKLLGSSAPDSSPVERVLEAPISEPVVAVEPRSIPRDVHENTSPPIPMQGIEVDEQVAVQQTGSIEVNPDVDDDTSSGTDNSTRNEHSSSESDSQRMVAQRPQRKRHPPCWQSSFLAYTRAAHAAVAYMRLPENVDPLSYEEAVYFSPYATNWQEGMQEEYNALVANLTFRWVKLPAGKKAIQSKWVYLRKENLDGSTHFKCRVVIKGYKQVQGIDFTETFAPGAKQVTVRLLLSLAAYYDWDIDQLDVKTAFLNPKLHEEVYMQLPEGYTDPEEQGRVWRLLKALYGLKQAPREWYAEIDSFLTSDSDLAFTRSEFDHNLYIRDDCILLLYVDDMLIFTKSNAVKKAIKKKLMDKYRMTDLGKAKTF